MSVAIPYIAKDFDLSPVVMGVVMSVFFAGYALCQIPGGMLADRFGSRRVMTSALVWWSAFTTFTGMASSLTSMLLIRVGFGIGEGVFPGGSWKSIAVWFPVKERATANAFMLSSNSLGPALAPLFVVAIMAAWGWRAVFYSLFIPGLLVSLLIWIFVTDKPAESKRVSVEELAEIQQVEPIIETSSAAKVGFFDIIKVPVVWQCFIIWFAFDITLWGFMSWLPTYLVKVRGFELVKMGIVASLPFFAGTIGLIVGGWISDKYFANHRKTPLITSQLLGALFLYMTYTVASADMAIIYQTLAGGFLFMAMGAFWALPMNTIPKSVMGVSSSFINTAGQIAGFLSPIIIGYLVQASGGSFDTAFMFLIAGALVSSLVATTVVEKQKQSISA
jgi:sugar phosphate permease